MQVMKSFKNAVVQPTQLYNLTIKFLLTGRSAEHWYYRKNRNKFFVEKQL